MREAPAARARRASLRAPQRERAEVPPRAVSKGEAMDNAVFGSLVDDLKVRPPAASDGVAPEAWRYLIHRRCGLTFRDTQVPALMGILVEEMRARGITEPLTYYQVLNEEPEGGPEWATLVERLLNHETSFFRHPASFDAVRTSVLPELLENRPRGSRLNFLSAGCSTGQEAYSLAMLAMDDEQLRGAFTVWGADISRQAIDVARRGRYGPRAVASVPAAYRERFLRHVNHGPSPEFEVVDELRQRVRFMPINLVTTSGVSLNHDVIFCHNVLIYFSPVAASQVLALLASRLKPGGYLLLGPGEGPSDRPPGLEAVTVGGVRALRRRSYRAEARS